MKLLLSSLLLASLCALSSWSVSSGTTAVIQSPDVSVVEGGTVNISCCWTLTFQQMTVNWIKNQTSIKSDNLKKDSIGSKCSYLIFTAIKRKDSGKYTCKVNVEIPSLQVSEGNGTVLTVVTGNNTTDNKTENNSSSPQWLTASLAVVAPVLLVALACLCILRRREAQAVRVIYESPQTDSEVAETDKHSTSSSRGSTQWCQVSVYESFDYFERVQTKESG
uniref:uncharacterized protein LOC124054983 isoform X2 n=1 Tax=Scatophagus argus TaxID=75038 RepID=UPI001ED81962|nr:uncharacterized protein LOC124054983 isoform X2 [Scatophagus argus]